MSSIKGRDYFTRLRNMPMPEENIGMCKNAYKRRGNSNPCGSFNVVLGNGLCMKCWDRGLAGLTWTQMKFLKEGE